MGLFSSLFGGGDSSSSTTTSTTQNTTDNRVAGTDSAVTLGTNAALTVNQPVTQQVVDIFDAFTNLAVQALQTSSKATETIYNAAAQVQTDATLSQGAKDAKSLLPYAALGVAGLIVLMMWSK